MAFMRGGHASPPRRRPHRRPHGVGPDPPVSRPASHHLRGRLDRWGRQHISTCFVSGSIRPAHDWLSAPFQTSLQGWLTQALWSAVGKVEGTAENVLQGMPRRPGPLPASRPDVPAALTPGGPISSPVTTLKSIRVGTVEAQNVAVAIDAEGHLPLGLLGMTFMRHFKVTVDQAQGQVTFERR